MKLVSRSGVALVALALAACGGTPPPRKSRTVWRLRVAPVAAPRVPVELIEFTPSSPAATAYNDPPITPAPPDPLADLIVAALRDATVRAGQTAPVADGRLQAAAIDLAAVVPKGAPVSYPAVEFALQRHGIIEPAPHLLVMWGPIDDPQAMLHQLVNKIPEFVHFGPFSTIGVGSAARGDDGEGAAVLILQVSHLHIDPIARALPAGARVELRGRIAPPYQHPQVFVTHASGDVDQLITRGTGGEFRVALSCRRHHGRQQVEITAIGVHGSTTLANFPIWCGQAPPLSMQVEYDPRDAETLTVAQAETRLLELINADRARYGLRRLYPDPAVAAVARAHSEEMSETGVIAHVTPGSGTASDRLEAAHIVTPVVLENVARAYGVVEAEQALMNSPGHRANILSRDADHVGVGIVVGQQIADRHELFITQLFTFRGADVDLAAAGTAVRKAIARVSGAREQRELTELAQRQAREVARGVSPEQSIAHAAVRARKLEGRYSRVTAAIVPVVRVRAFDVKSVFDPSITDYGIGIGQGPHPQLGEHAIYIVILIAGRGTAGGLMAPSTKR